MIFFFCSIMIHVATLPYSAEITLSDLFNALSSQALGKAVNRTSSFILAGQVSSKLVKSPLLVFHATLCDQLQAFSWEKLPRLIQSQRRPVWQSSKIITTTHTLSTQTQKVWCQHVFCLHQKKMPLRKRLTWTVKISHNEKLGARFNFA